MGSFFLYEAYGLMRKGCVRIKTAAKNTRTCICKNIICIVLSTLKGNTRRNLTLIKGRSQGQPLCGKNLEAEVFRGSRGWQTREGSQEEQSRREACLGPGLRSD